MKLVTSPLGSNLPLISALKWGIKLALSLPDLSSRGLRKLDGQTGFQKNCKTPFFQDIQISF